MQRWSDDADEDDGEGAALLGGDGRLEDGIEGERVSGRVQDFVDLS